MKFVLASANKVAYNVFWIEEFTTTTFKIKNVAMLKQCIICLTRACADPESFVRGGPTLIFF